ncbi:MAG: S41 family peptidase, partial [Prevotella sp.]|nr:S41 family peptidase [Prevotella sp.]
MRYSSIGIFRKPNLSLLILFVLFSLTSLTGCVDEDQYADNPKGNFEALWNIIDQHYCFFDYKAQQYGLDWNEIHTRYAKRINGEMTDAQLFEVLGNMLGELRDGHVNMYSSFNVARNWSWHENYPSNISDSLITKYLGTDYKIANGMKYRVLDDNIGYIRCSTFENKLGSGNLDEIMSDLLLTRGLIIDLRNNTGGMITSAEEFAARFTNKKILVGYMQHKTGKGHSDFSSMEEQYLEPSTGIRWQKSVVILTNRSVYSAANEFVKYMKCCP